jgi:hypothetical protein
LCIVRLVGGEGDDNIRSAAATPYGIFGTEGVAAVKPETLERYLDHLKQHPELPCQLTGIEDFPLGRDLFMGPGDKEEHEN